MKSALPLILLIVSSQVFALETDNYIVWGHELKDSSSKINQYLNSKITEALEESTGKSCLDVTQLIAKKFASYFVHDDPIANWLMENLRTDEMYPSTTNYVEESIYRNPYRFYIPKFGLAPNIQVNDRYFGLDKLSHFGATGKHYFDRYIKAISKNSSEDQAINEAIAYGIHEENTVYGYWASGVFSFADLEADYQGMLFYKNFCFSNKNPYLKKTTEGEWSIKRPVDIKEYVNAFWDESFNLSYRLPGNWKKVSPVIKDEYCPLLHSRSMKERFESYEQDRPSYSVQYLSSLQRSNHSDIPNPMLEQSIDSLCDH